MEALTGQHINVKNDAKQYQKSCIHCWQPAEINYKSKLSLL